MSSNQKIIIERYSSGAEDSRSEGSRSSGVEFYYTEKLLRRCIKPDSDVIGLGAATGYYAMRLADACKSYTGIDLSPDNIEIFNRKLADSGRTNVRAAVGDATRLENIPDNSFDAVFCLGPMYHLPPEERALVFDECRRIAKDGALLAFAYINRIGVYAGACCNDNWRKIYPNERTNRFVFDNSTDDVNPDVFFFTSPEEMEADASAHKLEPIANHGLDFFFASCAIDGMSDEQYACWLELSDRMVESRSCVGLANHALMICRK